MGIIYGEFIDESYVEEKALDNCKYKECPKCGSDKIGVYIEGEPIYKCKECGEYLGTVPFKESYVEEETRIFERGHFDKYKEYGEARLKEMSAKERAALDDDEFGIPELRKYPLHDKKHVEQAIKMFNHVEKKYESELADNILDAMERYHISTEIVGDKNRLKKYVQEFSIEIPITEGLIWNDNTPEDIKDLKEKIKDELTTSTDLKDIIDKFKDSLKNRDFSSEEKKAIYNVMKKVHVDIHGYTKKTASQSSIEISNTHQIIGTYKGYILNIKLLGARGNVGLTSIAINYNSEKSDIPKSVAFDMVSMLSPMIDKVKSTKRSITVSALSKAVDSGYPRISHKYSNKYNVKKTIGGLAIKLSTMKSVNESSPVTGAMHRQDFNPNSVYVVNYMMKNTFESDIAICKDKMSSIFICKDGKPVNISLTEFREMVESVDMFESIIDVNFDNIIKSSTCGLDFYKNLVQDESVTLESLKTDYRFNRVKYSYLDELNSIEECVLSSVPTNGIVHEIYCPVIPLIDENLDESCVHYFRDINGVFAQNINTLARSKSYKDKDSIPESTINLLQNI